MTFEATCLSVIAGALIGYCYGAVFGKRMQLYRQHLSTKKATMILLVALNFVLNYVLLAGALVLLVQHFTINPPFLLGAMLAAFFLKVYLLTKRPL